MNPGSSPVSNTPVDVLKVEKDHAGRKKLQASYGNLPLSFEANQGQLDSQVAFSSRGRGYSLFLTSSETVLSLKKRSKDPEKRAFVKTLAPIKEQPPAYLRMQLLGSNRNPRITGLDQLPGKSNYFIGNDPTKWRVNVTQYAKVKYEDVYSGVDVVYYGNQRQLEYDFIVSPNGQPRDIRFSFEGAQKLHIDGRGDLIVTVPGGVLKQHRPTAYQESSGGRKEIASRYVRLGKKQIGIAVGEYDRNLPLIIDPVLSYSTFLGGTDVDEARSIAVDESQNMYIVGTTASNDFPTANPFQSTNSGGNPCSGFLSFKDAFVYKLDSTGSALVYSTYFGGAGCEIAYDVAVDSSGNAYVVGQTFSPNFPTANAFQGTKRGTTDAFISKLNANGDALIYSTYLGSTSNADTETAQSVVIDQFGSAYMTGYASGTDFPTTPGCFQSSAAGNGATKAFVTKFSSTGASLEYSTVLGGNTFDLGSGIAIDSSGNAYVTGLTQSTDFPVLNPIQATLNDPAFNDGFITKLNATGTALIYSTYIGGTNDDHGGEIAVDPSGFAYVMGTTSSNDFPTVNAFQPVFGGGFFLQDPFWDGFVLKVNPAGSDLVYSTYLGGNNDDEILSMDLDSSGNVYIAGGTRSTNFPKKFPLQTTMRGVEDAFLTKLSSTGALLFSTYLGGTQHDVAIGVAVDSSEGVAYLTGRTCSTDYPTVNALYPFNGGVCDTFVSRISGLNTYQISGKVTDANGAGLAAVTLTLSGSTSGTTQTDGTGNYSFDALDAGGNYTITPTKSPYTFVPANKTFNNLSSSQTADFTVATYSISGSVTTAGNVALSSVTLTLTGTQTGTTQTDANGNYSFPAVAAGGSYNLTPSKTDALLTYSFTPASQALNNLSENQTVNFAATASITGALYPTADAHVQDGSFANTNFGTVTPIRLQKDSKANNGKNFDGYFTFDVGAIGGNVTHVKFRIFAALSAAGSVNTSVYSVANTWWVESGANSITWNNKPPLSGSALASANINSTTLTSYDIDVTAYVQQEKNAGRDVISLALHNLSASALFINVNSREAAANRPQLIFTVDTAPNAAPSVSLTNPSNGAPFISPANITVSANASDTDGSISKVEFFAGTTSIGLVTSTPYQITWPNVPVGSYSLTVIATDNSATSTVSDPVVISVSGPNSPPSVSLTSPLNGTILAANSNVTLNANASDADGTISSVEFLDGSTSLGVDNSAPYSINWNNAVPGAHSLRARATDNSGGQTTSAPENVSVVWQTGFSAVADAYVKDGSTASTNFGTAPELQVQQGASGSNRESYVRFDLTAVNGIARTKLRVFGRLSDTSGTNVSVGVYSVSSPASTNWLESGSTSITWNNKPASNTLMLIGTTTVTDNVGRWYEFDVSSHIQAEKTAGHSVVSFVLKSQAASNPFITFNSREASSNRPQLLVWTTQTRNALFAVGSSNLNAADTAAKTRLESLGFTVTLKVANNNLTTSDANGKALVVISSTCNAGNVTNKFRHVVVPLVNWEFDVHDDLGLTGTTAGTDFGTSAAGQTNVSITNSGHVLAAGLSGTVQVVNNGSSFSFSWGAPNANAAKIASLTSDANKSVIFGYDSGAAMPGLEAPARRVGLFMTDLTAGSFNGNGNALFDAAVRWATELITAPAITLLTPGTGPAGTVVTISGSNFGPTQGTSTVSFNSRPASVTSWSDKTIVTAVPLYATTGIVVVRINGVDSNGMIFTVAEHDSDGDGLADWWELQYFGNLAQNANGDPDNDGLTNLQEYQQGRNPTKSALSDTGDFVNLKIYTPLSP